MFFFLILRKVDNDVEDFWWSRKLGPGMFGEPLKSVFIKSRNSEFFGSGGSLFLGGRVTVEKH